MAKKIKKSKSSASSYSFHYGKRTVQLIADKVILFRLMRQLHGRFWGLAGVIIMMTGFSICFLIRPDMMKWSTAFSDFGGDLRTAPYLAISLFFGAYGLWRWRIYLRRTLRRDKPVTFLVGLTVLGLYVAALMPVTWLTVPSKIHTIGIALSGVSIALTVAADTLLTRVRNNKHATTWRMARLLSFLMIAAGGYITFCSSSVFGPAIMELSLLGELLMIGGYTIWIIDKTYLGEGRRTRLSESLKKLVLID